MTRKHLAILLFVVALVSLPNCSTLEKRVGVAETETPTTANKKQPSRLLRFQDTHGTWHDRNESMTYEEQWKSIHDEQGLTAARSSDEIFSRFTALEGAWLADAGEMGTFEVTYRTIANGSSVVETMHYGDPSEMISVFHQDIDHLRLTHYCAVRNQPHLIATEIDENHVTFESDFVTNHQDPNATYMGKATWTFIDADHIQTKWWSFTNGEQQQPIVFALERIQ
ncbi:MAG: hypothetical protein H8E86_07315 [Planctomycetes bacterium]|nr:hypothetical protein [Planctomycetota bacterium]